MKKNDLINLTITAIANSGNGVGRHSTGIAVFVPFSAAGDELYVRIVKIERNFAFGIIEEIINPSPYRIMPDCEAFGKCGGCNFRHISYGEELRQKAGFVSDAFERIGKFDLSREIGEIEIIGGGGDNSGEEDDGENRYRNKAQVPFEGGVCGYYAPRSHRIVPCGDCKLQTEEMNRIIAKTAEILSEAGDKGETDEMNKTGGDSKNIRTIYVRRGHYSGEIMLCIVAKRPLDKYITAKIIQYVKTENNIKSLILNINPDDTNVILGKKNITLYGADSISDKICGIEVDLFPNAFYQVNTPQAEKLYTKAVEFAAIDENATALDLYCGIGALTCLLARKAKKLYGAEIIPAAIKSAKINAKRAGLENIEFFCGDAGEIAGKLSVEKIDVIVIDPPRKGCDEFTISNILKINPKRIVVISCDPATAARDAKKLKEGGYALKKLEAFDMFPRTANVECVFLMTR
jgi:23S rRNA (uracil1939-C5)-methyltransferase